ncbi:hypothetical protein BTJ39_15590 [Izhakiella australiensis]|uniref:Uncharacterized protein n=1 Tax=Izhakiella australiensis TaxID=1926881 RepID=A0A1S8YJJ8_9GAMM|nr:hypothetical protein [Izhakiella australiensis]OON39068.1 hypothetical protein BTJ39_15590 [Izhakiella australiensis]
MLLMVLIFSLLVINLFGYRNKMHELDMRAGEKAIKTDAVSRKPVPQRRYRLKTDDVSANLYQQAFLRRTNEARQGEPQGGGESERCVGNASRTARTAG